jgi:hypothetical protein
MLATSPGTSIPSADVRRRARPVLLVTALALAACGGPTPEKAAQARDRAASTATSAGLVASAWDSGAAPGIYASDALAGMAKALEKDSAAPVWSALPGPARDPILRELGILRATTAALDSAVRRRDRPTLDALRGSLGDHGRALTAVEIDTVP